MAAVRAALSSGPGAGRDAYPLHAPVFEGNERRYLLDCIDSTFVSYVGEYVAKFEQLLSDYTGGAHVRAVTSGTAALHLCALLAGVRPGDEVVTPALTFVATANAVAYAGGVPHFADCEERTMGLDPAKLAEHLRDVAEPDPKGTKGGCRNRLTGRRIGAVVAVHVFGHPVDLDPLLETCERFGIPLIEDAAESLGSTYRGRHAGRFGLLSCLSFNGNKIVTTGGGGAVMTESRELAQAARHLSTTAKLPHRWEYLHDQVGYNYRLPNINAALGCAQLERLPAALEGKRALAARYAEAFRNVPGARFFQEADFARSNYWLNAVILDDAGDRDELLEALHGSGCFSRPVWTLLHRLPMYADCPRMDLSTAEDLERRIVNIPSGPGL